MAPFDLPMVDADSWVRCDDLSHYYHFYLGESGWGELSDRSLRLFAVACLRGVLHLSADDCCKRAVEVAEQHADKPNQRALQSARQVAERAYHQLSSSNSITDQT